MEAVLGLGVEVHGGGARGAPVEQRDDGQDGEDAVDSGAPRGRHVGRAIGV